MLGPLLFLVFINVIVNEIGSCIRLFRPLSGRRGSVHFFLFTGPRSAVGNVSGYRCEADCRSGGREFDPGPVPYFRGD